MVMKPNCHFVILFIFPIALIGGKWKSSGRKSRGIDEEKASYVVNHEYCLSCLSEKDKEPKETLHDVHTYAQLKQDYYLFQCQDNVWH